MSPQTIASSQIPGFDPSKRPDLHGCRTSCGFSIRPEHPSGRFENSQEMPLASAFGRLDALKRQNPPERKETRLCHG
jgi:hypothetical protein